MNNRTHYNVVRRAARLAVFVGVVGVLVATTSPAGAVPEGWNEPEPVDISHAVLLLVGAPLLIMLLVALFSIGPSMARGDGRSGPDALWFGGPRRGVEAASDDTAAIESSESGGARGQW